MHSSISTFSWERKIAQIADDETANEHWILNKTKFQIKSKWFNEVRKLKKNENDGKRRVSTTSQDKLYGMFAVE